MARCITVSRAPSFVSAVSSVIAAIPSTSLLLLRRHCIDNIQLSRAEAGVCGAGFLRFCFAARGKNLAFGVKCGCQELDLWLGCGGRERLLKLLICRVAGVRAEGYLLFDAWVSHRICWCLHPGRWLCATAELSKE